MTSVNSYEFVSISSSFSFDLAGATLFLTPFMRTSSYYIFQGFQRRFSTRKKMKTEFIIYILIIPSFYKFVIVINSFFFIFFFLIKKSSHLCCLSWFVPPVFMYQCWPRGTGHHCHRLGPGGCLVMLVQEREPFVESPPLPPVPVPFLPFLLSSH